MQCNKLLKGSGHIIRLTKTCKSFEKIYQKISHQYKKDLSGKHSHLLSREKGGFCFRNNRGFHKRPVKGVIVKLDK